MTNPTHINENMFGTTSSLSSINNFDYQTQDWNIYKIRLCQWFIANNIDDTTDKTGVKRKAILLCALEENTYKLAYNLALPDKLNAINYESILKIFDDHFTKRRCEFADRHKFYAAVQQTGETYSEWAARLRGLATYCGFKNLEDSLLDKFVTGMLVGNERDNLFTQDIEGLTLGRAVELAESVRRARAGPASVTRDEGAVTGAMTGGAAELSGTSSAEPNGEDDCELTNDSQNNLRKINDENRVVSHIPSNKDVVGSMPENDVKGTQETLGLEKYDLKTWVIDSSDLVLMEEIGSTSFSVVRRGKWRGLIDMAVKMIKVEPRPGYDPIEEVKVMTQLQHTNLVRLYGVCSKHRPISIVTEYMRHGSLLNYLRGKSHDQIRQATLLDMSIQVCEAMAYLESHKYIHGDLAAINCWVGDGHIVKLADCSITRYVKDDLYTSPDGSKFAIKWAAPEVLEYTRFSSKSDVWAFGVLMWEIFTYGDVPYARKKNIEVLDMVLSGLFLDKPKGCLSDVYNVMRACWKLTPEERPSFRVLEEMLVQIEQSKLADATAQ